MNVPPPTPKRKDPTHLPKSSAMPVWKILRGGVRSELAFYTPEDICEIDCKKTIEKLKHLYCYSCACPRNDVEWAYVSIMSMCVWKRFDEL